MLNRIGQSFIIKLVLKLGLSGTRIAYQQQGVKLWINSYFSFPVSTTSRQVKERKKEKEKIYSQEKEKIIPGFQLLYTYFIKTIPKLPTKHRINNMSSAYEQLKG